MLSGRSGSIFNRLLSASRLFTTASHLRLVMVDSLFAFFTCFVLSVSPFKGQVVRSIISGASMSDRPPLQ
jgi:hypothetical protein